MKKILLLLSFILVASLSMAQSGYKTSRYYSSKGSVQTQTRNIFVGYNNWGVAIYQKQCNTSRWYSEYRSGYYYIWGEYGWYNQWYEGYQWYYSWSGWYNCY